MAMRNFGEHYTGYEAAIDFQNGLEIGFTYFYKTLYSDLRYYASRIVKDIPTAEDIVEESFIKIWERHKTFTHPKVIKAWMYTTVRNGCLNKLTSYNTKNRVVFIEEDILVSLNNEQVESHEHAMIRAEVVGEIYRYIAELPRACREIFELMYKQGLSVRQISAQLNLEISTIKTQKARGLGIIRKKEEKRKRLLEKYLEESTIPEENRIVLQEKSQMGEHYLTDSLIYRMSKDDSDAWKSYTAIMAEPIANSLFLGIDRITKEEKINIVAKAIRITRVNYPVKQLDLPEQGYHQISKLRQSIETVASKILSEYMNKRSIPYSMPERVYNMREKIGLTFRVISGKLGVTLYTVRKYYDNYTLQLAEQSNIIQTN